MHHVFREQFNELLVELFHSIEAVEQGSIQRMGVADLSLGEVHLIACVAQGECARRTVGELSQALSITPSSVTAAIHKIEKKGYVEKVRSTDDGRVVYVQLTEKGSAAAEAHRQFHLEMVASASREFSGEECALLVGCIHRLNVFFKEQA